MNRYNAVLFDFGGTLDSDGINWKERFFPIYPSAGLKWEYHEYEKYFYYADDFLTERKLKTVSFKKTIEWQVSLVLKAGRSFTDNLVKEISRVFIQDSLTTIRRNNPLLKELKKKYSLGIVSNFYGNLPVICREIGFNKLFDVVIDSSRVGVIKPIPKIFFCALDQLKTKAEKSVFVGDSPSRDMAGAKKLGMDHIWLRAENTRAHKPCCKNDKVIQSLLDLEKILL